MGVMKQAKPKILPTKINSMRMGRGCLECTVVVVMTGAPPPSISRNISDPMKSCARARFLVQKGEASMHIPYDLCIGTKRLGTFHRTCAFSSEASHMSTNLCKQGGGFGTSFSCARTIIGQRTLTKLINRRAFRSPCALQHSTTTSLLTPPRCNPDVTLLKFNGTKGKETNCFEEGGETKVSYTMIYMYTFMVNQMQFVYSQANNC